MSSSTTTNNNNPTPAQQEFQDLLDKNTGGDSPRVHPEDRDDARREEDNGDEDEDDRYLNEQIDAAMRMPSLGGPTEGGGTFKLPPANFDSNHSTGVKGVIADARAYEEARQSKWRNRVRAARRSVFGMGDVVKPKDTQSIDSEEDQDRDEEAFLQQWRESRRLELESEARSGVRNRRTSPSLRMFGRLDTVDALGYLDAIEKVGRETVVVVFVYDHEVRHLSCSHPEERANTTTVPSIWYDPAGLKAACVSKPAGSLCQNPL
jgi:hypothetical protein